jgi:acetoacetyl-CoA synthetase
MGLDGIVERFSQIRPKLLFVDSRILYGGRTLDLRKKLQAASRQLQREVEQLEQIVVMTGDTWDYPGV